MLRGPPAALDVPLDPVVRGISSRAAESTDESRIEVAFTPNPSWRRDDIVRRTKRITVLTAGIAVGDATVEGKEASAWYPRTAAIATMTTTRPVTRSLRLRVR